MLRLRLAVATHLKHSAISGRYVNIYHHNRARLINGLLRRKPVGTAAKFMPQRNHQAVRHKGYKYMSLNPVLELMMYRTHCQIAFQILKRRLNPFGFAQGRLCVSRI